MSVDSDCGAIRTVFDAALVALNEAHFTSAAHLCDPVSLQVMARHLQQMFQQPEVLPHLTVEEMQRVAPDMPREAAEYHITQARRQAAEGGRLAELLPTCPSVEAALAAAPDELFAWWLEGRRMTYQIRRLEARGLAPAGSAELHETHEPGLGLQLVVLGVVADGPDTAHVIYRDDHGDPATWPAESRAWLAAMAPEEAALALEQVVRSTVRSALTRRQPDGSWRLVAGLDFLSIGNRMIANVS